MRSTRIPGPCTVRPRRRRQRPQGAVGALEPGAGRRSRNGCVAPPVSKRSSRTRAGRSGGSTRSSGSAPGPGRAPPDSQGRLAASREFGIGSGQPSPGRAGSSHPHAKQESAQTDYTANRDLTGSDETRRYRQQHHHRDQLSEHRGSDHQGGEHERRGKGPPDRGERHVKKTQPVTTPVRG